MSYFDIKKVVFMSCLKKSSIRVPYTQLTLSPSIKVSESLTVRKAIFTSEISPMTKNLITIKPRYSNNEIWRYACNSIEEA